MLDMASVILSVAGLLVSLIAYIRTVYDNRKIRQNNAVDIKSITLKYDASFQDLNNKIAANQCFLSSLVVHLKDIHEILVSIYPSIHFCISVKVIHADIDPSKAIAKNLVTIDNGVYKKSETSPICIKDNTEFSAILIEGREFFFVSDIDEYDRLRNYKNSDATFRKRWASSLVFPIKKALHPYSSQIIGFLCISSKNRLNNIKNNEIIMKLFPRIAENLYGVLANIVQKNIEA